MLNYLYHPPFDVLNEQERNELAKHSQVVYLDDKASVPDAWVGDFFLIIKGKLSQYHNDELIAGLNTYDWFSTIPKKDGSHYHFITREQSLLYRMNGETLLKITQTNTTLQELLFADLSLRRQHYHNRHTTAQGQQLMHQSIRSLGEHIKPAHFVAHDASIFDAVVLMNDKHIKHVLVSPAPDNPKIGMFTQTDVCRIIANKIALTDNVRAHCCFKLQTIHADQELSEALLLMLHHKIHRLPIVDDTGEITGILGQTELLHFLTNHSQLIVAKIDGAKNIDDLQIAVDMVGKFIRYNAQSGTKTHVIARTVQSLNAQIFAKLWQMIAPPAVFDNTCLFVMGSEGRGEQIMRTDQDNALIIRDNFYDDKLADYANEFNDSLAKLGYPYCDGKIMINNEQWRLSLGDFKKQISDWFSRTDDSMIWLATLLDAHYVCGDSELFNELTNHIDYAYRHATSNFINRFGKAIIQFGDQSQFWQKFTGSSQSDIDLKKAGIFPIVHGVRTLALENHITATSTRTRLFELAKLGVLQKDTATNLVEALDFFLSKRLEAALDSSDRSAWRVNPNTLSALERDLLKESLAVVKDFKGLVFRHYRLDVFGA